MIHVIDYKIGNIGSVVNMLHHLGAQVTVASCPKDIEGADKIILPGVGSFDAGVAALRNSGFDEALKQVVSERNSMLLGICLGMQLLMDHSEEGDSPGLGLVAGAVKKIAIEHDKMRIPHMGWNTVEVTRNSRLLDSSLSEERRFYFVHSYYVDCSDEHDVVGVTSYGSRFTSMFEKDRIMGVQFHPEKSHRYGKELFKNFVAA